MLKKLTHYYNEDGEPVNIEDDKIYWDTQKNQFRHKFLCSDCKTSLECRCYDELLEALIGVEDGLVCRECGISEALNELSISDLMDELNSERLEKVNEFMIGLLTQEELKNIARGVIRENLDGNEIFEIIDESDRSDELRDYIISLLTDDEKNDIYYNSLDNWANGEACNI